MAARWQKTGIATLRKNNATLQRIPRPLKADKRRFFGWICKANRCQEMLGEMLTFTYIKAALFKGKMTLPSEFAGDRKKRTFGKKKRTFACGEPSKTQYKTAKVQGCTLRNPKIKSEILKLKQERLNREFLPESGVFQKYTAIVAGSQNSKKVCTQNQEKCAYKN